MSLQRLQTKTLNYSRTKGSNTYLDKGSQYHQPSFEHTSGLTQIRHGCRTAPISSYQQKEKTDSSGRNITEEFRSRRNCSIHYNDDRLATHTVT